MVTIFYNTAKNTSHFKYKNFNVKRTHPSWYEGYFLIPEGYNINGKYPDAIHSAVPTRQLQKPGQSFNKRLLLRLCVFKRKK
jgi:hypothetical protein